MKGKLYGVGVGPGDPELMTLKAHRIIRETAVIAYPAPDTGPSFAREIAAQYLVRDKTEIPIIVPMRTERFPAQTVYDNSAAEISTHLDAGNDVCVLCEGDPFFYGSFMYLYERMVGDYDCEIIPGVSSLMASACALGRPLAARNDILTIIPAPLENSDIEAKLEGSDAVAFIKIGRHFTRIRELINRAGLMDRAGYLERISLGSEKIMPLAQVNEDYAPYFSIILIYRGGEDWINLIAPGQDSATRNLEASG